MMDRTGGLGTDEKERGEHVHLHFMPISVKWRGNQSGWEEEGFMISSALMDGCYLWCMIVFAAFLCRLFDILKAVDTAKTHSAMMCNSKNVIYSFSKRGMFIQILAVFPAAANVSAA